MSSETPRFDNDPRPSSSAGNHLIWSLLAGLGLLVIVGVGFWFAGAVRDARLAAQRSASKNNLKMIGLALHNYYDVFGVLPPSAVVDERGVARQGWMCFLLPFGDRTPIYDQIDVNHAWNAPPNVPHSQWTNSLYLNPAIRVEQDAHGFGLTHYAANSRLFEPNKSWTFREITDGTSNTIMAGEINAGFTPWAMPPNTRDPAKGLNKGPDTFGSPYPGGVQFLMSDGAVRLLSHDTAPQLLKALATPNGGEPVPADY